MAPSRFPGEKNWFLKRPSTSNSDISLVIQVPRFVASLIPFIGPHEKTLELLLRQFISSLMHRNLNPRSLVQTVIQIVSIDSDAVDPVPASAGDISNQ